MKRKQYTVLSHAGTVKHSVRALGPDDALESALSAEGQFKLLDVLDISDFECTKTGNRYVYNVEGDYYVVIPE
jgi:hypothetical protein